MKNTFRNIIIGWIDGMTVSFALAMGLSGIGSASLTIWKVGLIVVIAGALTMTMGGYLSGKKYMPDSQPAVSALLIGIGYLAGGLITIGVYRLISHPTTALQYSMVIVCAGLLISGYFDSAWNGASGWLGALRITCTALVTAAAAFGVARLFV